MNFGNWYNVCKWERIITAARPTRRHCAGHRPTAKTTTARLCLAPRKIRATVIQSCRDARCRGDWTSRIIQSRDRLRAELANIPDAPPPVTVEYDYATIRAMLDNLSITLQMSASVDTAAANRAMLALFDAVEFDGKSIVRVVWRAPFESFNVWLFALGVYLYWNTACGVSVSAPVECTAFNLFRVKVAPTFQLWNMYLQRFIV